MILAQRELLAQEQAERIAAQSEAKVIRLEIERLKLLLAKARREKFGQSSERGKQLIEQLELAIEDLEETQGAEEAKAEIAAPEATKEKNKRAPRGPRKLPEDLPVERIVEPAPCACGKCGGARLRKLGEVVTRTLESEPRRWKIVEHVREKFTCRDCEAITEPPAPSHPIARGFAGPSLLAMILVSKFLLHQPLNRQSATYAREGVEIDTSTLADWVGACVVTLDPVLALLKAHVLRGERIHADDTTVPVLAKGKTATGRSSGFVAPNRSAMPSPTRPTEAPIPLGDPPSAATTAATSSSRAAPSSGKGSPSASSARRRLSATKARAATARNDPSSGNPADHAAIAASLSRTASTADPNTGSSPAAVTRWLTVSSLNTCRATSERRSPGAAAFGGNSSPVDPVAPKRLNSKSGSSSSSPHSATSSSASRLSGTARSLGSSVTNGNCVSVWGPLIPRAELPLGNDRPPALSCEPHGPPQ